MALTEARRAGARVSVVVSAGSTGLSNAAYAVRAGLRSVSLMSDGAPDPRVYPLSVYGSHLVEVSAGIDDIIAATCALAGHHGISVASTTRASNPFQAEGPKTIAYEVVEQLGWPPDWMVIPVAAVELLREFGAVFWNCNSAAPSPACHASWALCLKPITHSQLLMRAELQPRRHSLTCPCARIYRPL